MEKSKSLRGLFLVIGLFSAIAFLSPKTALAQGCEERCGNGDKKSLFCHIPQGNPNNPQDICIADSAVSHHLEEHSGDHCGSCETTCEEIVCCDENPVEAAALVLDEGVLLVQDSDGKVGDLCCEPDTDGDGQCGAVDQCPNDPEKLAPGDCGCGFPDTDSDGNGTADCNEGCTEESGPDTDGDGTPDCNDNCPSDPAKTSPGICGCGVSDIDSDANGIADCNDDGGELAGFPDAPTTPAAAPAKPNSFGGGFCQLLKTDKIESSTGSSSAWALVFGTTTLLLLTLRRTPALRSRSK